MFGCSRIFHGCYRKININGMLIMCKCIIWWGKCDENVTWLCYIKFFNLIWLILCYEWWADGLLLLNVLIIKFRLLVVWLINKSKDVMSFEKNIVFRHRNAFWSIRRSLVNHYLVNCCLVDRCLVDSCLVGRCLIDLCLINQVDYKN